MNPDEQFGKVIWHDQNFVVRGQVDSMESLHIVVHRKVDGREVVPVGYVTGITALDISS